MVTLATMCHNEADVERSEDRRWDGAWGREKENIQTVGMTVVETVLLPAKAGYGSVLGWRKLKLEEKLQERELGKEVASGKGKRLDKELCSGGRLKWQNKVHESS